MTISRETYCGKLEDKGFRLQLLDPFVNGTTSIKHRCLVCKHVFDAKPSVVYIKKTAGCPNCAKELLRERIGSYGKLGLHSRAAKTTAQYKRDVRIANPDVTVLGEYVNCSTPISHRCKHCRHEWDAMPINIRRGTKCPECAGKRKTVQLAGTTFSIQGYEHLALQWLSDNTEVNVSRISTKPPRFEYDFANKRRHYTPDFLIGKRSIIEVKSIYTLGVLNDRPVYGKTPTEVWAQIKAKAKAVEDAGYSFVLMVMRANGTRIQLPTQWRRMSRNQLMRALGAQIPQRKNSTRRV